MMYRAVALFAFAATAVNAQIPEGVGDLINLIPAACLIAAQTSVIPCFLENPVCLENIPTGEEIMALPIPEEISQCSDLLDPACPLLLDCEACLQPLGDLLKCIVANLDADVPQETVDLIESCPVDCSGSMEGNVTMAPMPSEAPVDMPTPMMTDAPSGMGSMETAMPSAASRGVLSLGITAVAVAAAAFSF
ncbi:MAG: hypothetical protein SGILL_010858 [Bacillariaceae sp.]